VNDSIELENVLEDNKEVFEGVVTFPDVMTIKLTKSSNLPRIINC